MSKIYFSRILGYETGKRSTQMGRYEDYNEMLYEAYCKAAIDNAILKEQMKKAARSRAETLAPVPVSCPAFPSVSCWLSPSAPCICPAPGHSSDGVLPACGSAPASAGSCTAISPSAGAVSGEASSSSILALPSKSIPTSRGIRLTGPRTEKGRQRFRKTA